MACRGTYLKIDSSSRLNPASTSPGEFTIQLSSGLIGQYRLCQAYIPSSFFNINSTNNKLPFYEDGTAKLASLTAGYYDTATLLTEIATQLNAASASYATYTVTQSFLPLRITISSTQSFSLQFGTRPTESCASILGFSANDTASSTSAVATGICNLATVRSFAIQINNEIGFTDSSGHHCTFLVPITGNSGSLSLYEPPISFSQTVWFTSTTNTLNIRVCDDSGVTLGLTADWYLIIKKA